MTYEGGCHCGNVRYKVKMTLDKVMSCNCSICSKRGHLLAFAGEDAFTLVSGADSLSDYQFYKKAVHHVFCKNCGISSFMHGTNPKGETMYAINVRCLDNVDATQYPVEHVDGKSF